MERSFPTDRTNLRGDVDESFAGAVASARRSATEAAGRWPVLAQIPDVSPGVRSAAKPLRADGSQLSPVDYRFDPPEARSRNILTGDAVTLPGNYTGGMPRGLQPPAPHLRREPSNESAIQHARSSRILPRTDPFSTPSASLHEQVAPLVRFLIMVALFTVAGTSVLMMYNQSGGAVSNELPAATTAAHEPDTVAAANQFADAAPTLTPAPPAASPDVARSLDQRSHTELVAESPSAAESSVAPEQAATDSQLPYPTTNFPAESITDSAAADLPRVQTSDDAPAVARFTGQIHEAPTRHAKHDDQSSIH